LILSLAGYSESWVTDSAASFHATSRLDIFQNDVKGELGKVYLGDDEPGDIVGKGDVMVSLSDDSTLKLRNVKLVPRLKRNMIFVCQLANGGMKTPFDGDMCKITKGVMVMARDKKEGTLYMTLGFGVSISVASSELDAEVWHRRFGHMSEKGMKVMLSKDKLLGLKIYRFRFL